MKAVENALRFFLPLEEKGHLVRTDNMSVVSYINRQGAEFDLFASQDNVQCPIGFTKNKDVLRENGFSVLLAALFWQNQVWFPELMQLQSLAPWPVPLRRDLLSQAGAGVDTYIAGAGDNCQKRDEENSPEQGSTAEQPIGARAASPSTTKKSKQDDVVAAGAHADDASNAAILAAIGTLQNMMQDFKDDLKQNTLTIANIVKAVEFNSAEIKDCKEQSQKLHVEVKQLKEMNTELGKRAAEVEKRAVELERYKRRWNLQVNGLKEVKDENTRQIIFEIIRKIMPHWRDKMDFILDSVHCLGPSNTNRPRQIIMQFTGRHFRDELWRITKLYSVCKDLNIRFAEDLTKEDRVARKVEQARKIPKEENASNIEQFRTISLLSVECKTFFKIVSNRLMGFLLKNTYIDTSVQKGGIPGVPGCIEHTGVVTQLIREAREGKGDLAVLWLDLANAYGSIPHRLVELALSRYHVPEKIQNLILDYYNNFSLRVSSGTLISEWQRLEKGIITGCTISVSLFALAMNMLVKSAEVECRGPLSRTGTRQPPIRAFMEDLTVTTTTVPGCRWLLRGLEQLITWARMSFKPAKSRSLVLRKGKVADQFRFMLGDTRIPSVSEKPVKSLGKLFTHNLKDTAARKGTSDDFDTWLLAVDKSGLPGRFKAWIYQHGILPRLLWPLRIYEVPITTVEGFERKVSRFLRRWLGLPRSLSSIAFFGHNTKLQLPLSSLAEEFKVTRAREVLLYRDSVDTKVSSAGVEVRTGRKWRAQDAVERAEARLRHSTLVGTVATGRAGFGSNPKPCYSKARGKEKRKLIQEEVRAEVEEARFSRVVGMSKQGAWTKWEQTAGRKITWAELWKAEPHHFKFLVQSVYDVLPSPANLFTWGLVDSPACQLCQKRGSLEHILSCCPKALGDGRYRWRHDQILKAVADAICIGINISKQHHPTKSAIAFVRAGEKPQPPRKTQGGVLAKARDWHLLVDLGTQLRFPDTIAVTTLRPDMVLMSAASKQVVLLELTVPWEERMEEAQERKRAKYADLVAECRRNGWKARCEPVEVGCRGFAGQSLHRVLGLLGICGLHRQRAIKNILEAAEKAARWLWLRRGDAWHRALPGHKSGLDHPRLGRPGGGV
ncbi:uncharacterized protein LOC120460516 [Pimephales promelas]|uniref:uncharacterized protein LOC120460516 n=1 Tax=Pimephales promelas TaxID=90988 RepID=UPI001955ABE3|nr:uncharacterized protein LOC120460516 [Pimephales promelas]